MYRQIYHLVRIVLFLVILGTPHRSVIHIISGTAVREKILFETFELETRFCRQSYHSPLLLTVVEHRKV